MNYYFEKCCFDYEFVRKTSQCDRITCQGNHDPDFSGFFFIKLIMNLVIV